MLVYIISFILSLFFSIFAFNKIRTTKHKYTKIMFSIISALPLFIVAAFRYGVGNDYFSYADYFSNSLHIQYMEYGFDFLIKIIRNFTTNYVALFVVCSFIFFYFIFKAIYEQSVNPTLSIFLFVCAPYYFEFFSGMRQMMAVAIFLYSIKYIKQRKLLRYLIFNLIGASFHSSSFVFIPIYWLYNIRITPKMFFTLFLAILISRPMLKNILYEVIYMTNYASYIGGQFDNDHFGIVTFIIPLFIFLFAMMFYNSNKEKKDELEVKEYQLYCNLMFIQLLIASIQDLVPLITRLGWGFGISQIILIPLTISKIKKPKDRFCITTLICILFLIYVVIMRFSGGGGTLLPFKWIFDV